MKELAAFFKFMYFYSQMAHHKVKFSTFFSDHDYLGELYEAYDAAYDGIVERMIGAGEEVNEFDIINAAAAQFNKHREDNFDKNISYFAQILAFEKQLCAMLSEVAKNASLGTNDQLAGFCNDSESRQYKIGQRVK
jgi:DNA-binding ferritin-like protein